MKIITEINILIPTDYDDTLWEGKTAEELEQRSTTAYKELVTEALPHQAAIAIISYKADFPTQMMEKDK